MSSKANRVSLQLIKKITLVSGILRIYLFLSTEVILYLLHHLRRPAEVCSLLVENYSNSREVAHSAPSLNFRPAAVVAADLPVSHNILGHCKECRYPQSNTPATNIRKRHTKNLLFIGSQRSLHVEPIFRQYLLYSLYYFTEYYFTVLPILLHYFTVGPNPT